LRDGGAGKSWSRRSAVGGRRSAVGRRGSSVVGHEGCERGTTTCTARVGFARSLHGTVSVGEVAFGCGVDESLAGDFGNRCQVGSNAAEERILNLLSSQNMCVLATVGEHGPLATPVRYFHLGFGIMFTASPRSPKMRNIAARPQISVGIFAPLVGLASSRGAQVFGTAEVIAADDARFDRYWEAFRWESEQIEQGRSPTAIPGSVVVIEAERIVYTEHWLRKDGYSPRQFWKREPPQG
jgi:nitroimidazol reductase NimA-like FMN-containing flavoprotein (pyridoxamine 5'-phosphate oxidase superfamily)